MYPANIKSAFLWNQQYSIDTVLLDVVGGPFCLYSAEISRDNNFAFLPSERASARATIYQIDSGEQIVALPQALTSDGPFYVNRPYIGFDIGDDLYAQITDSASGIDSGHDNGNYQFEVLYTEGACASSSVASSSRDVTYYDWMLVNAWIVFLLSFIALGFFLSPMFKYKRKH